ncbi:MAG: diphthine synthase, partial [Candidatus Nanoarchaeia archaeon]
MLYIIGLGLNKDGISKYGLDTAKRCKKVYLENYTIEFPYALSELIEVIEKDIKTLNREEVESLSLVDESKKKDVALLVYGSPLTATTHITLLQECLASNVKCKVIYSASIIDAVAETGLQLYKFGKTASMPEFEADSYLENVKDNQKINAHSLILVDIGLNFKDALDKLEKDSKNKNLRLGKIVVCSNLGTKYQKIVYDHVEKLKDVTLDAALNHPT